ncbi:MAG: TonB-dependent receptor [Sulfuricella sp.]
MLQLREIKLKPIPALLAVVFLNSFAAQAAETTNLGSVQAEAASSTTTAASESTNFDSKPLSDKAKQKSTQSVKTVSKSNITLFGPDAGGMQALSIIPNVQINSYNASSVSSRSSISMRGVKVGWNSIPGDLETNGITAELDGVPLNSLSQGTGWHSPEIPIGVLLSGVNVIQGPGNPDDRWYNSLGGTINFVPIQPTKDENSKISFSLGSFSTNVMSATHNTGEINGWSTVFGYARARSQSIRTTPDSLPSKSDQLYIKTRKQLANGSISFGAYAQQNDEYRPNMIPLVANPEIHLDGLNGTGPLYSQQTSGFYSTLPKSVWFKDNAVKNYMAWSRQRLDLAPDLQMTNMFWVRNGNIRHYRVNNYNPPANVEYYTEHSNTLGDKLKFDAQLSKENTLSFGGYWINSRAESNYVGYAPSIGYFAGNPSQIFFNTTHSSYWSVFAQDDFQPFSSLHIVPGIRVVGFQTDFMNNSPTVANNYYPSGLPQDPNLAYVFDQNPNQSTNFVRTEPSIGFNWGIANGLNVYGNYAIARRNPTSRNYDKYPIDISTIKLVRSKTYDIGLRYLGRHTAGLQKISGSIGYFHTMLDNQTIPRTVAGSQVTTFGYGSSTLKGFDIQLEGDLNDHWSGFSNLGWLKSNWNSFYSTTTNAYYNGYPISNSPSLTANAGITYKYFMPTGTVETTLWDQYYGHSNLYDNGNGAPTRQKKPGYNLVNLSVQARTTMFNSSIPGIKLTTISLQGLNLLDKKYNSTEYISSGGYFQTASSGYVIANAGAPRSIYLSISADF